MWHDTPSANDLRENFPELALALETDYLADCLDRLGIQYIRRSRRKTAIFEVAMHPNHLLRIGPVDKGADGYAEWMTRFWKQPDSEEAAPSLDCSIRAYVEFIDLNDEEDAKPIAFTSHCDDMPDLLRNAIGGMRHLTGKRLKPLVISRRKAA